MKAHDIYQFSSSRQFPMYLRYTLIGANSHVHRELDQFIPQWEKLSFDGCMSLKVHLDFTWHSSRLHDRKALLLNLNEGLIEWFCDELLLYLVAQCSATPATVAATPPCSATPFQTEISVRHLPEPGGGRCDTKIFRGVARHRCYTCKTL